MAKNLKFSTLLKNAQQDAITSQCGASAILELYSGAQPASPDTAITSQVLLSSHTCNATFAPAAAGGVVTMNAIGNGTGTAGAAAGTRATWYRLKTSGGVAKIDGSVGVADQLNTDGTASPGAVYDIQMTGSNSIATGQTVQITANTYTNGN